MSSAPSLGWVACRRADPRRAAEVGGLGPEVDLPEAPDVGEPERDRLVERPLELAAGVVVDHPPGGDGVRAGRAALVRRVDVDAAEELRLVLGEHGVVERLLARDLL